MQVTDLAVVVAAMILNPRAKRRRRMEHEVAQTAQVPDRSTAVAFSPELDPDVLV